MYIKGISTTHWWGGAVCSDLVFRLYLIHSSLCPVIYFFIVLQQCCRDSTMKQEVGARVFLGKNVSVCLNVARDHCFAFMLCALCRNLYQASGHILRIFHEFQKHFCHTPYPRLLNLKMERKFLKLVCFDSPRDKGELLVSAI